MPPAEERCSRCLRCTPRLLVRRPQLCSLQRLFHPGARGAAELDSMLPQLLVKVPHVLIEIPLSIQSKTLLHRGHRHWQIGSK